VPGQTPLDSPEKSVLSDRLDSWKEIAAYLKRDVRTVQRYGRWLAARLPRPTSRLKLGWDKASELLKGTAPQVFTRVEQAAGAAYCGGSASGSEASGQGGSSFTRTHKIANGRIVNTIATSKPSRATSPIL
jgi:hypothetical protein